MSPKIIKNDAQHAAALARLEEIFDARPGTAKGDELELLTLLVEQYEKAALPIGLPTPLAAIRFRMDQQGLKAKDLVPFLGSASKVSEVLSGRRGLSLNMIRNLVVGLGIPAQCLLGVAEERLRDDNGRRGTAERKSVGKRTGFSRVAASKRMVKRRRARALQDAAARQSASVSRNLSA